MFCCRPDRPLRLALGWACLSVWRRELERQKTARAITPCSRRLHSVCDPARRARRKGIRSSIAQFRDTQSQQWPLRGISRGLRNWRSTGSTLRSLSSAAQPTEPAVKSSRPECTSSTGIRSRLAVVQRNAGTAQSGSTKLSDYSRP
jgi:hypothetical protein